MFSLNLFQIGVSQDLMTMVYGVSVLMWGGIIILYAVNMKYLREAHSMFVKTMVFIGLDYIYLFSYSSLFGYIYSNDIQKLTQWNVSQQINIALTLFVLFIVAVWWLPKELRRIIESKAKDIKKFEVMIENSSDITIILDKKGYIKYVSSNIVKIISKNINDLIDIHINKILTDKKEFTNQFKKISSQKSKTVIVPELYFAKNRGRIVCFEVKITNMLDVDEVKGIVLNCRDISKRRKVIDTLKKRLDMDNLVTKISSSFIDLSDGMLNKKIEDTLGQISSYLNADRSYIFLKKDPKSNILSKTYSWRLYEEYGDEELIDITQSKFPWLAKRLAGLEVVCLKSFEDIPQKAKAERKFIKNAKIKSLLYVPISDKGKFVGFIGVDTVLDYYSWSRENITFVALVGEIISSAIVRYSGQEELYTLSQAVEQSPSSVVITDISGVVEYVNSKFSQLTGYSRREIIGKNLSILKSGHTTKDQYKKLWKTISSGKRWTGEIYNKRKDDSLFWEDVSISPLKDSKDEIKNYIRLGNDLSVQKGYEEKLSYNSNHDELTGLPNRTLLVDRLRGSLLRSVKESENTAVLFIGLDMFKRVNDTYGHEIGDKIIKAVANLIKKTIGNDDTLSRFGGDEFVVLISDLQSSEIEITIEGSISKILNSFRKGFDIKGEHIDLTASIGVAVSPHDADNENDLLRNAGAALSNAKAAGGNQFKFFTSEMQEHAVKRSIMETHLRHALENDEFSLHYQPIVEVKGNKLIGAEALIRWKNRELGMVSPVDFIPLAEDLGLIIPIGEWVLREACKQIKKWNKIDNAPEYVTVNVSMRQFKDNDFAETVKTVFKEVGVKSSQINLEMTESLFMNDIDEINAIIESLKGLGLKISMDDFGTGYSSLSYLKDYDFDTLKIDRTFVSDIDSKKDGATALIEGIIVMAHSLKLDVVAEGVETLEQLEYLQKLKCDKIQGYYYSKPLPSREFNKYIKAWGSV